MCPVCLWGTRGGIPRLTNNRQGYGKYVGVVRDGKLNNASLGESVGGN